MRRRLRRHGITARPSRAAALLHLAQTLPPAILADLLGISESRAADWRARPRETRPGTPPRPPDSCNRDEPGAVLTGPQADLLTDKATRFVVRDRVPLSDRRLKHSGLRTDEIPGRDGCVAANPDERDGHG